MSLHTLSSLLPPEILHQILDILQQSGHLGALASFQRTSNKTNYTITAPYLYKEISISENNLVDLLYTLCTLKKQYETTLDDRTEVTVLRYTVLRDALKQCQKIILKDTLPQKSISDAFQNTIDEVQRTLSSPAPFPNLQNVSLLVYRATGSTFSKVLKQVVMPICHPQTICVRWFDIFETSNIVYLLETWEHLNENDQIDLIIHEADASIMFNRDFLPRTLRISYHRHYPSNDVSLLYVVVRSIRSAAVEIGADSTKSSIWRIMVLRAQDDNFPITATESLKHYLQVESGKLEAYCVNQSFDHERTLEWCEGIKWVSEAEQENEPGCEKCGTHI